MIDVVGVKTDPNLNYIIHYQCQGQCYIFPRNANPFVDLVLVLVINSITILMKANILITY